LRKRFLSVSAVKRSRKRRKLHSCRRRLISAFYDCSVSLPPPRIPRLRQSRWLKAPTADQVQTGCPRVQNVCTGQPGRRTDIANELHRSSNSEARQRLRSASSTPLMVCRVNTSQLSLTEPSQSLVRVCETPLCHSMLLPHSISGFATSARRHQSRRGATADV